MSAGNASPFVLPHPHPKTTTDAPPPAVVGTAAPAAPAIGAVEEDLHTKRLAWDRIRSNEMKAGTVWSKLAHDTVDDEDAAELQAMFAVAPTAPAAAAVQAKIVAAQQQQGGAHAEESKQPIAQPTAKTSAYVPVFSVNGAAPPVPAASQLKPIGASSTPPFSPGIPDEFPTPRSYSPSNSSRGGGSAVAPAHHGTRNLQAPAGSGLENSRSRSGSASPLSILASKRNVSNNDAPHSASRPSPPVPTTAAGKHLQVHTANPASPISSTSVISTSSGSGHGAPVSHTATTGMAVTPTPASGNGPHSRRGSRGSDSLRLPLSGGALKAIHHEEASSTPSKHSLGEILAQQFGDGRSIAKTPGFLARTPQPQSRRLTRENSRSSILSGAGPEHFSRQASLASQQAAFRPSTPQPKGRTLGKYGEVKIDSDLMPNFVFLQSKKPMMAATLPPPSPASTGRSMSPSPSIMGGKGAATPRNMELASLHAHASPMGTLRTVGKSGDTLQVVTVDPPPRRWTVSPAPPTGLTLNVSSPIPGGGNSSLHLGNGGAPSHPACESMTSPPSMLSPVVLGSGCLADVLSTTERVVSNMGREGGVVAVDDDAIVRLVTEHRHAFARAARHEDGEFVTQMLQHKYNDEGITGYDATAANEMMHARTEDAAKVLSAKHMRTAVPFAPREWFYAPSNLGLVVTYHLVLQALDFGLENVPPLPASSVAPAVSLLPSGTDPANAREAVRAANEAMARLVGPPVPYCSADLARSLATVARSSPHAFDAERLTKMDPVRLGSWLQPHIFDEALRARPELKHDQELLLSSPTSNPADAIPFTYPDLAERARMLREIGYVLLRFFNGSTAKLVERAEHSASKLVELVTQHFPSFRDLGVYRGRMVFLYTRAQSFVRNVWVAFHGHALGLFHDLHELNARSDALLPAILQGLGILRYSREMKSFVEKRTDFSMLPSDVELELRSASMHAILRISQVLKNLDISVMPIQLDLWLRSHYDASTHSLTAFWREGDDDEEREEDWFALQQLEKEPNLPMLRLHKSTGVWY